jgi:hypothetical protein
MFFVVDRPRLQRIIAIVRKDRTPDTQDSNAPFLRLEARGDELTVDGGEVSGTFPAAVYESGVLFLRTTIFRRLLRTMVG